MNKPTLHLIGIFHTIHNQDYSHCAFTGKALRFPRMLQNQGWRVVEYSNEGSESQALEKRIMIPRSEFQEIVGSRKDTAFHGTDAILGNAYHQAFEKRLHRALHDEVREGDIICHPFGHAHAWVVDAFPQCQHVETGIGYAKTMPKAFHIYESEAWRHTHIERDRRTGLNYEWVIPNYFEVDDWKLAAGPREYVAFMGRICEEKGMRTVREIAARLDIPVWVAGQGDIAPWAHPNLIYQGSLKGTDRSDFMAKAICNLLPTNFVEPFGGSAIEGLMAGVPAVTVDYGAFTETIQQGVNGYRCKTLRNWLDAVDLCQGMSDTQRAKISVEAKSRYSLEACGVLYDQAFQMLADLRRGGWYKDCPPAS